MGLGEWSPNAVGYVSAARWGIAGFGVMWAFLAYLMVCNNFFRVRIFEDRLETVPSPWTLKRSTIALSGVAGVGLVCEAVGPSWARGALAWHLSVWDAQRNRTRIRGMSRPQTTEMGRRLVRSGDSRLSHSIIGAAACRILDQVRRLQGADGAIATPLPLRFIDEASAGRRPWAFWTPYAGLEIFAENPKASRYFREATTRPASTAPR